LRGQLLETLNLPPTLLAESSDALYLKLLPNAPQSANLMTREQHAITHLHWLKRGLLFVAAAWMGVAMLTSLLLWLDAWRIEHAADQIHANTLTNHAQEARLLASAGGVDVLKRRMQIVQAWHSISETEHEPAKLFESVLDIGQQVGKLHFQRLVWSTGEISDTTHAGSAATVLKLEGEIAHFDNDFSAAHQRVQHLAKQLQNAFPEQQVRVTRWPLNTDITNDLEGEFGHSMVNARFQIELSRVSP